MQYTTVHDSIDKIKTLILETTRVDITRNSYIPKFTYQEQNTLKGVSRKMFLFFVKYMRHHYKAINYIFENTGFFIMRKIARV